MTNTLNLPIFPSTPRARTALRDLLNAADELNTAAYMTGGDCQELVATILIIAESIAEADAAEQARAERARLVLPPGVFKRSARTTARVVEDGMLALTDGSFEVVAYEVFDHPDAVRDVSEQTARTFDVDPGSTLGVWFVGPRQPVEDYVMAHYAEFTEQYSAGYE